jgi:hypothetical protein
MKTAAFIQILKKKCIEKGNNFNEAYPRIGTDLEEIAKDRNDFAHKLMLHPESIGNSVIILLSFKNKIEQIPYTQEQLDLITNKLKKYHIYCLKN